MQPEIEAKWLRIDKDQMRAVLTQAGATLVAPERMMRRRVFDYPDGRLDKNENGWIRVRDEGDKITLSYKRLEDRTVTGTKEVTLVVDNYDTACQFLESIGLQCFTIQETQRESWTLDLAAIELDTWPWIPPFIEIEAADEPLLEVVAAKLGLDYTQALHGSVEIAYQDVYDVTETEVNDWDEMLFSEVPPSWLRAKQKPKPK